MSGRIGPKSTRSCHCSRLTGVENGDMVLHDVAAEVPFEATFDACFPYGDASAASALIAQGWSISLNAAFCVLDEICRPGRGVDVSRQTLVELVSEWRSGPEHPLKASLITCAHALIDDVPLPWPDGVRIMEEIAKHDAQRAALGIAYFASDCDTPEGDRALEDARQRIVREWEQKGV